MRLTKSIAFRLIIAFALCSAVIFTGATAYNYNSSRKIMESRLESYARNLVMAKVNRVETTLASTGAVTESLARTIETMPFDADNIIELTRRHIESNSEIFGCALVFESDSPVFRNGVHSPYFFRNTEGKISSSDLGDISSIENLDWYQIPKMLERTEWSEPYFDENGGRINMTTCSVPFYFTEGGIRRFAGIVTADVSLEKLTGIVSSIKILRTGYAFLLSRTGTILAHPSKNLIMNESMFSIAESHGDTTLRGIARKMIAGESGFIPYTNVSGVKTWMYYAPVPTTGWTLAVIFPENELLADIRIMSMKMMVMGIAGIFLLVIVAVFVSGSITTPIRALAKASHEIASGNFDVALPEIKRMDEVGILASDFRMMTDSLKDHMSRLEETIAAKERIESELKIAHDIQMSILPKIFPPFPNRDEFDLYALIEPAREVGGDFYDFFQIDDNLLCFVIADVSGKGVPASLFMAVTKTLIKSMAREGIMPDELLLKINAELCQDNETCMFVSLFCGMLDTSTGELIYSNGGHNPPLIVKKGGLVSWFPKATSLVIGAMEDITFRCERMMLEPGDGIFLYTDGVTEAMNKDEELYSESRLENALARLSSETIRGVMKGVMDSVREFTAGAPQSDDITMMMIRYNGGKTGGEPEA